MSQAPLRRGFCFYVPPLLVWGLVGVSTITGLGTALWIYDEQRISELVALSVVAILMPWVTVRSTTQYLPRGVTALVGFAFIWGGLAALLSNNPAFAFAEWARFVLLGALLWLLRCWREKLGIAADRFMLTALAAVIMLYCFGQAGTYAAIVGNRLPVDTTQFFNGFDNRRFFAHFQTFTLPLLAVAACGSESLPAVRRPGVILAAVRGLLVLWWCFVFAGASRGTWLGIAAGMAVLGVLGRGPARLLLRMQVGGAVAGAMLFWLLFLQVPAQMQIGATVEAVSPAHIASVDDRLSLWRQALSVMTAHPWFGLGPLQFAGLGNGFGRHPHNALLQFGAEWGLPVLAALVALLWVAARRMMLVLRSDRDAAEPMCKLVLAGLAASLSGALTQAMVDGIFVVPVSEFLFFALAGWAAGLCAADVSSTGALRVGSSNRLRTMAFAFVVGSAVWLAVFAAHFAPQLKQRADTEFASMQMLLPRFWVDGRLVW